MGESLIQRAFAAGELAPALHARADQAKYQTGLRTCLNFLVRREGGVSNRPGTRFIEECKTAVYGARLVRFVGSEPGTSYLIEMGEGYFRFFLNGAAVVVGSATAWSAATNYVVGDLVSSGGSIYYATAASINVVPPNGSFWHLLPGGLLEIPNTYTIATLPQWNQSGNVITLTSLYKLPQELIFLGPTRWVLRNVATASATAAPINVAGTAAGAGTRTFKYIVTAAAIGTYEESIGSAIATVNNTIEPTVNAVIPLTWDAPVVANSVVEWYVYCDPFLNGVFGYVGTASTNAFKHAGQTPDFNITPPLARVLFDDPNEYPACSSNYQQRRFFANSILEPDAIWGSRIGFPSNMGLSSPIQDDDAVTFRLAGNNHHPIRYMLALKAGLILFTDGGAWPLTGGGGSKTAITPGSINADQETYVGISLRARPLGIGNGAVYVQQHGNIVHDLHFDQAVEGLAGRDLTIYATHLFERKTLHAVDYQQAPDSIIWAVRSDGALLGLTYIPEQDIWGWHRHTTDGLFEDVCVVPENGEDVVYVIVRRTINAVDHRYIERLARRDILDGSVHATSFFVDSGLSYSGAAVDDFAGLDHLEGKRVAVYADGLALYDGVSSSSPVVQAGAVHLPANRTNVHIGLPYTAEFETLDVDAPGTAVRDVQKRTSTVSVLIDRSSKTFEVAAADSDYRWVDPEEWEANADLNTGQIEVKVPGRFNKYGRIKIRQAWPLPLTIIGVIPHVEVGG